MYRGIKVAVVIPAYRAEATIATVVTSLPSWVDAVVVVDDASPDRTAEVVAGIADPRLTLLRRPRNGGVGAAMKTGFARVAESDADVVVKMDSDAQMDPQQLPSLLDPLVDGRCDYTKGNRFLHGSALAAMPALRFLGNLALTFLTKLASGYWHVFDPQNGYVACRLSALKRLPLDRIANDYFFENDMLVNLNIHEFRVLDVHMPARYEGESSSMQIWRILVTFPLRLVSRFWRRILLRYVLRDFSPVALFLALGIPLFLWGVGFGAWGWYQSWLTEVVASTGTVMVSVLPLVLGFQLILHAILLDIQFCPK
jgi:glycosyltransferase involved in cell wall biosynthesis